MAATNELVTSCGILGPIKEAIKCGMSVHVLALSIAVGVYGGVFPIWGTQSLACITLGVPLGASLVVYVAVNQLMSGIALVLIPTFIWVGEQALNVEEPFEASSLVNMLQADPLGTMKSAQVALFRGVVGWCLLAPPSIALVYSLVRLISALLASLRRVCGSVGNTAEQSTKVAGAVSSRGRPSRVVSPGK